MLSIEKCTELDFLSFFSNYLKHLGPPGLKVGTEGLLLIAEGAEYSGHLYTIFCSFPKFFEK